MCHVMMGNLVMFRKDSVLNILSKLKPDEGHAQSNHVDFVNLIMLLVCYSSISGLGDVRAIQHMAAFPGTQCTP